MSQIFSNRSKISKQENVSMNNKRLLADYTKHNWIAQCTMQKKLHSFHQLLIWIFHYLYNSQREEDLMIDSQSLLKITRQDFHSFDLISISAWWSIWIRIQRSSLYLMSLNDVIRSIQYSFDNIHQWTRKRIIVVESFDQKRKWRSKSFIRILIHLFSWNCTLQYLNNIEWYLDFVEKEKHGYVFIVQSCKESKWKENRKWIRIFGIIYSRIHSRWIQTRDEKRLFFLD